MSLKPDPHQVEHLPFVPVGRFPNSCQRRHLRQLSCYVVSPSRKADLQGEPMSMTKARQVIHDFQMGFETSLRRLLRVRFEEIGPRDTVQNFELGPFVIPEKGRNLDQIGRLDHDVRVQTILRTGMDAIAEFFLQQSDYFGCGHEKLSLRGLGFRLGGFGVGVGFFRGVEWFGNEDRAGAFRNR